MKIHQIGHASRNRERQGTKYSNKVPVIYELNENNHSWGRPVFRHLGEEERSKPQSPQKGKHVPWPELEEEVGASLLIRGAELGEEASVSQRLAKHEAQGGTFRLVCVGTLLEKWKKMNRLSIIFCSSSSG